MSRLFSIITMGCQMNEADSDSLAATLSRSGFQEAAEIEDSDLILINTCTVREKPENKAYSLIGRLSKLKGKKPDLVIGVVGCLAQEEGSTLTRRFRGVVDMVVGPREIHRINEFVERAFQNGEIVVATDTNAPPVKPAFHENYPEGRVSDYISIMVGCNNFCSYCVVPYVRGREASRPPGEILERAGKLVKNGVKEITLLGQNVNSYSWGGRDGYDFPSLLRAMDRMEGLERLRFTTSHPKDLSDELVRCFAELRTLCPHIHLPFQAGSNSVLKAMRRGYTREDYIDLIQRLRRSRPDISITSDVMVGFPGETEEDFRKTLDLIESIEFDALFSFKYSDRKDTLAGKMSAKVDEKTKGARLGILQSRQKEITLKRNKAFEQTTREVLVEGGGKRAGQVSGRIPQNIIVNFEGSQSLSGQIIRVYIKRGLLNSLQGQALSA